MDAFLTHNDTLMRGNVHGTLCDGRVVLDATMGWDYYTLLRSVPSTMFRLILYIHNH